MKVAVIDIQGKDTGRKVELSKDVFGIEPNNHAIYLDVKAHLANKRQGTHQAKERGEIVGSTRKIKNKREQVLHVQDQLKTHCLEVGAVCLDHVFVITVKRPIKK